MRDQVPSPTLCQFNCPVDCSDIEQYQRNNHRHDEFLDVAVDRDCCSSEIACKQAGKNDKECDGSHLKVDTGNHDVCSRGGRRFLFLSGSSYAPTNSLEGEGEDVAADKDDAVVASREKGVLSPENMDKFSEG